MKKKKVISVDDRLETANKTWDKIKNDIENGIIDREKIVLGMTMLNVAAYIALNEGKRDLLND